MKRIYVILLTVLTPFILASCFTKTPVESPPPRVKNFDIDADKASNFVKANEWMVETFNDASSVIQFSDKEAGIVKGKYVMKKGFVSTSAYVASTDPYYAIITIRVKDNAVRIEIDPPSGMYSLKSGTVEAGFTPSMFNASADELIKEFEARMTKGSTKSDW